MSILVPWAMSAMKRVTVTMDQKSWRVTKVTEIEKEAWQVGYNADDKISARSR